MPLIQDRARETDRTNRELPTDRAVQNIAGYQQPIWATLDGRSVKIIATGDLPGHSPVCQYVDQFGRLNWEEAGLFTVVDPAFLPASLDAIRDAVNNTRTTR